MVISPPLIRLASIVVGYRDMGRFHFGSVEKLMKSYRTNAPAAGWALFALAVAVVGGYLLTRGVLIGSRAEVRFRGNGEAAYFHKCRYLYLSGVREVLGTPIVYETREEAEKQFCAPLGNSN